MISFSAERKGIPDNTATNADAAEAPELKPAPSEPDLPKAIGEPLVTAATSSTLSDRGADGAAQTNPESASAEVSPRQEAMSAHPYPERLAHDIAQRHDAQKVEATDGFVNYVLAADERIVIKVPQVDRPPYVRPKILEVLANEAKALKYLESIGADFDSVAIPRLVEYSTDPAHLVATFVPGRASVTPEEIQGLSQLERERLGADFGSFMAKMAGVVDEQGRAALSMERIFPQAFEKYIGRFSDPRYPELTRMAATLYERWQTYQSSQREGEASPTFMHGDLTLRNVTLSDNYRLQGVFDFASTGMGDLAEELSDIVNIDPIVSKSCIDELRNAGLEVNPGHAWLWRELKDFHVLPSWIMSGNPQHPNFIRLRDTIANRYPNVDWSELYRY